MTTALITGITGQDGAYLAQFLLGLGYTVHGTYRSAAATSFWRIEHLGINHHPGLHLVEHDLTDAGASIRLLEGTGADEVYNLAALSSVAASFEDPTTTAAVTGFGPLNLLEAIRVVDPRIRFYQASTSEMFGTVRAFPQNEETAFCPRSPYGVAKLYAHWMTMKYRDRHDMFCASGILFNHESPLRGREFVTRKITAAVARLEAGRMDGDWNSPHEADRPCLELGNLDAKRDWGYAREYTEGMWRMLQADQPSSYVLATGRAVTVREFVRMAFRAVGIELEFRGRAESETAVVASMGEPSVAPELLAGKRALEPGQTVVRVNPKLYRPSEVEMLVGSPEKVKRELGWEARTPLEELCQMMVAEDLRRVASGEQRLDGPGTVGEHSHLRTFDQGPRTSSRCSDGSTRASITEALPQP